MAVPVGFSLHSVSIFREYRGKEPAGQFSLTRVRVLTLVREIRSIALLCSICKFRSPEWRETNVWPFSAKRLATEQKSLSSGRGRIEAQQITPCLCIAFPERHKREYLVSREHSSDSAGIYRSSLVASKLAQLCSERPSASRIWDCLF